ncbi:MAG: TolC family protein, partial [Pseudomonadota bacterium]
MKWLIIAVFYLAPMSSWALTQEEVVSSSLKHFPQVIQSMQSLEQATQEARAARGAFDGKIKFDADARTEGYYDGDAYKATIEKPIPFFNSKIYGGKRQSYGDFPVYEGKSVTLDNGELFAGASVSLLRNAMIDENRYEIRNRDQLEIQAKEKLRMSQIEVQTAALKAYWTWFIKGQELRVFEDILGLAQKRARQIARRIKAGDLARIYETENNQYIRKREAQLNQSQIDFQKASYYLSLFYRDKDGRPIVMNKESVPMLKNKTLQPGINQSQVFDRALGENIDLKILDSQRQQAQLDVRLGTNEILPKVDVNFEWSQDQTATAQPVLQEENRIMLKLEVPFQYRKGLGKRNAGKAKLEQIKTKTQWVKEKLSVSVNTMVMQLAAMADIYRLTLDQVNLSKKLAKAERRKFSQGASDLILVNIREENMADAQIKNAVLLLAFVLERQDKLEQSPM